MTLRQKRALSAVATGMTYRQAALASGYKHSESVHRVVSSPAGQREIARIAAKIESDAIYSVRERITQLKALVNEHQFSDPQFSLQCIKQVNRLTKFENANR